MNAHFCSILKLFIFFYSSPKRYDFFPKSSSKESKGNYYSLSKIYGYLFFNLYFYFISSKRSFVSLCIVNIYVCSLLSSSFILNSSSIIFLAIAGFLILILCLDVGGVDAFSEVSLSLMIFLFIFCWKLFDVVFILFILAPFCYRTWSILFLLSPVTVFFYEFISLRFLAFGKGLGSLNSFFSELLFIFDSYLFESCFTFLNYVTFSRR